MNQNLKIKLLKRKFLSKEYIESFFSNYKDFIQTGLSALEQYQAYRQIHPNYTPNEVVTFEERFWEKRVKPNFLRMGHSCKTTQERVRRGDSDCLAYLDGLAGDFRGLSRGFDGVGEEFMDVATPELRKKYLLLYKQTSRQATIIESTINDWWDDDELLNERITGPVDEDELFNYLEPGETVV